MTTNAFPELVTLATALARAREPARLTIFMALVIFPMFLMALMRCLTACRKPYHDRGAASQRRPLPFRRHRESTTSRDRPRVAVPGAWHAAFYMVYAWLAAPTQRTSLIGSMAHTVRDEGTARSK